MGRFPVFTGRTDCKVHAAFPEMIRATCFLHERRNGFCWRRGLFFEAVCGRQQTDQSRRPQPLRGTSGDAAFVPIRSSDLPKPCRWSRWYLDLHLIDSERSADSAALLQTGADLPFPVASRWCECWRGPPSLLAGVSFARGKKPRQLLGRASSLGSLHPDNKSSGAPDQET